MSVVHVVHLEHVLGLVLVFILFQQVQIDLVPVVGYSWCDVGLVTLTFSSTPDANKNEDDYNED